MSNNAVVGAGNSGFGLGTVLFVVFLVLKLTGTIAWSWWWVTSPLWIPWVLVFVTVVFTFVFVGIVSLLESSDSRRQRALQEARRKFSR